MIDPFADVKKNHIDTSKTPDRELKLSSKNTGFSDKEIKRAKKKLKKLGVPKELWFMDLVNEETEEHIRYWL